MNRNLYWAVLLNPVFLILYSFGLPALYSLCEYGGVRRRLPLIAAAFVCGFFWFLIWTILYFARKNKTGKKMAGAKWLKWVLLVELAVLLGLTGYYEYRMLYVRGII